MSHRVCNTVSTQCFITEQPVLEGKFLTGLGKERMWGLCSPLSKLSDCQDDLTNRG